MIKRKDGTYSQRGLWDNIRANKGSGKKPTAEMLKQERKINNENKMGGLKKKKKGGFPDNNKDGKITQADIFLQKKKTGTIKNKKGGVKKKKKMYGGPKKMMGMGGTSKKMMYKAGGFLLPPTEEI